MTAENDENEREADVKYPKTVPILQASDICKRRHTNRETHCLLGWMDTVFLTKHDRYVPGRFDIRDKVRTALQRAIIKVASPATSSIATFNDDPKTPYKTIAKVWNRAMALLGYTEGNPEA